MKGRAITLASLLFFSPYSASLETKVQNSAQEQVQAISPEFFNNLKSEASRLPSQNNAHYQQGPYYDFFEKVIYWYGLPMNMFELVNPTSKIEVKELSSAILILCSIRNDDGSTVNAIWLKSDHAIFGGVTKDNLPLISERYNLRPPYP